MCQQEAHNGSVSSFTSSPQGAAVIRLCVNDKVTTQHAVVMQQQETVATKTSRKQMRAQGCTNQQQVDPSPAPDESHCDLQLASIASDA